MEEGATCIICEERPSSVYVRVNVQANQQSVSIDLLNVDVNWLFEDYPDAVGVICLKCLLAYRRQERDALPSV